MKLIQKSKLTCTYPLEPTQDTKWSVWNNKIHIEGNRFVLFNAYTHCAVLMDESEYSAPDALSATDREMLYENGFLVDAGTDERRLWMEEYVKGREDMSYIDLTIMLTEDCQMRCQYCFEGAKQRKTISEATISRVMEFMKRHADVCKRLRVTWFGGEPLMGYKYLKDMSQTLMSFCKDNDITYSADITTNGFALSDARCKELVEELKVKRFIITIDGPEKIHERRRPLVSNKPTFTIIMRNIEMLTNLGAFVLVRMTIDKENAEHIPEFLDYLANSPLKGRVGLAFCRTIDYNYTPDDVKELLFTEAEFVDVEWNLIQYAHKLGMWKYGFPHSAPLGGCLRKGDIVVGVEGELYKCLDTLGDERWLEGNIDDDCSKAPDWLQRWNEWTPFESDKCACCQLVPLCNGGCPHNALFEDKKHGSDTGCPDWKGNYKRQIKALITEEHEEFQ